MSEAQHRRFERDEKAPLEDDQPHPLEERKIRSQDESGPDEKPGPLPETHGDHQPERNEQEDRQEGDRQEQKRPEDAATGPPPLAPQAQADLNRAHSDS